MPKQLLHEGQTVMLVPMLDPDGKPSDGMLYQPGTAPESMRPKGTIVEQEPSVFVMWQKANDDRDTGEPGYEGYVRIGMAIDVTRLRRELDYYDRHIASTDPAALVGQQARIVFESDPFSWRDLTVSAKALAKARDDAFGRAE